MERLLNYFSRRLLRRRRMITHKSPFKKTFDLYNSYVWIMSSVMGFEFFDTLLAIQHFGSHSVYNYFMAAFLFIIPLWCYLELTSLICSHGGVYHFTYSLANEFVGFMVGWMQILCTISFTSYVSSLAGAFVNESLFSGAFERGIQKYWFMDWSVDVHFYLNRSPNLLGFFFSTLAAAASCPLQAVTVVQVIFFYAISCFWMCFMMIITAYLNMDYLVMPNAKSVATFFSSYYEITYMYPTTFSLLYLGGDVENPERNIPLSMTSCFVTAWLFYSVFSLLITISWDIQDVHPFYVLSDIAFKTGGHYFYGLIDIVAFTCVCTTLFVYFTTLTRVVISMAKDGLLFAVFSRVEKRTRHTAKPTLLLGIIAGTVAIFVQRNFLERVSKVCELLLALTAPVCVLLLRYTDAFHHLLRVKQESAVLNEPVEHIGITIWAAVICVLVMGYSVSLWTAGFFISPFYGTSDQAYRVGITGAIFVVATIVLLFQKQNHYKSAYKVPLVPFLPIISLFTQSFMLPVIPTPYTVTILTWMGLGGVFYFSYSMHYSKEVFSK